MVGVWGADRVGMHLPRAAIRQRHRRQQPRGPVPPCRPGTRPAEVKVFICAREHLGPDWKGPDLKKAFGGVYIVNESFDEKTAEQMLAKGEADAAAFGKLFIANPDLRGASPRAPSSTSGTFDLLRRGAGRLYRLRLPPRRSEPSARRARLPPLPAICYIPSANATQLIANR